MSDFQDSFYQAGNFACDQKVAATRLWRVTGSLPPNEKSHNFRRNAMFIVEADTLPLAIAAAEKLEPDIDLHSVNHYGHLRKA